MLQGIARAAMRARGLLADFSPEALRQAQTATAAPATGAGLRDLTALLWASIDNDDSRDLDQLSVAASPGGGAAKILVAIADVDAVVGAGSAVDKHASANTTSVYTAAQIFPMLPERLSTDLTSLGEGAARASIVVEMSVGADGSVAQGDIYRAAVINHAKLAYRSVGAWLAGTGPIPARVAAVAGLDAQLRLQDEIAQHLKRARQARGALTLTTFETRPVFTNGVLTDLEPDAVNRASELIEDFMIAANGVAARYLGSKGLPSVRRVLRTPERWDRIVALAAGLGARLPATPDAPALNAFLIHSRDANPERFGDLSLAVVKLLGRGEYVLQRPGEDADGHFGLAVRDYAHSTAPNRRFPDVIMQRLLKAALAGTPAPYPDAALSTLAAHCTEQEHNAQKVERQVGKSAAALLLAKRIGQHFDALVTGASPAATWVRIREPTVEGLLIRGAAGLDVGDRLRVELVHTDVARGFIDFARVG
jgi:VacB/RNase II family 3'-5' exoribonuclease